MSEKGTAAPVVAGLAVGVAFVVAFAWAASAGMLPPSTKQQDAYNSAIKMTSELNEVQEFFSVYPDANTTVYFITTCVDDESCSNLWRIPSIVEYWYRAEDQRHAQLRVTIDYEEGKATFSHASCTIYGTEEEGVGIYGAVPLEGVAELLRDGHCPK